MAIYLGGNGEKLNIVISGTSHRPYIIVDTSSKDKLRLLSSDNYILKDSQGLYITAKED